MTRETLETIVSGALAYAGGSSCTFGFQGGEPTLAGLDFFQHVIELQDKHNIQNSTVQNSIQTNGTLLDEKWAVFFRENNFLVGLSLDGYENLHDSYRRDALGNGTHRRVMEAVNLLNAFHVDFNVLAVATAQMCKNARQVYDFFMENGLVFQQYIPCLEPLGAQPGRQEYSLTPELYAHFLKTLFDAWYEDRKRETFVYIRYFENLAALLLRRFPESCDMNGVCSPQFAIESDGSVYPCDFYMLDAFKLGNLHVHSFEQIEQTRKESGFVERSMILNERCQKCEVAYYCSGGCRRLRDESGMHYYCEAYRKFLPYAIPKIMELMR